MKKLYLVLALAFVLILPMITAEEMALGTYKQKACINLIQTCSNCTYNNITKVLYPDSTIALRDVNMTKSGTFYNYSFCQTEVIGTYIVNGHGDLDGVDTAWSYTFEVTPSGFEDTMGFYFILILIISATIGLGFAIKDGWFVVIGGMCLIILGLYSINSGIAGFKDSFLTWAIALFEIGIGAYLGVNSAIELIGDTAVS